MNYQDMSGYEINTRIHNVIECGNRFEIKVEGYRVTWTDRVTGEEIVTLRKQYDKSFKNYLGSWADAGSIIKDYEIELSYDGVCWSAKSGVRNIEWVSDWKNYPEEPLRMAMIVFLMMREESL